MRNNKSEHEFNYVREWVFTIGAILIMLALIFSCENKPDKPVRTGPVNPLKVFHLNYKAEKDWSKCDSSDYVVFDMFDTSKEDFQRCKAMGATMLCYFSSQYESWRPDSNQFGRLGGDLGNWDGERYVQVSDPANLAVMFSRLIMAKDKCDGIDLDNIDANGHKEYVLQIFKKAKELGLLVSQKNAIEDIDFYSQYVDLYQNEQCQQFDECEGYFNLGKPVFNIEYQSCKQVPQMYSVRKDIKLMNKWEVLCN